VLTKDTKCPNQVFYVWLVNLQTISTKYWLETYFPPNDDIRKFFLNMKLGWTKNAFWDVNNKKWRKRCKFVSPSLFYNTHGLPVLTMDTNSPNQIFYVSLVDLQKFCAKQGLETWLFPNNDIRICLLDMKYSWTKNAFWDVNNKKWRKWCKFVSPFLINNTYGLLVLTMGTKCPNQVFYVWLVDLQTICAKWVMETWLSPNNDIGICLPDMRHSWTKYAISNMKSKKWRKWRKFISPILFKITYGLPVLTMDTKGPNQVFYFWLVDLRAICAK
jgi:hypothetical protein